ncbi:restriction endonuclease subunit S [Streptococcus suis]|uniref:restriction endonuclease subunit S n=1 Tax=Streptococcus suis TaxID=1307 RepID=UPI00040BAE90|nr:restriction endonuclease subunit S [Streptococcus suis]
MSEWKLKSLKDLSVSITSGLTPLKSNSEYWNNPVIPWLKTDQLGEKYIWDTNTKISEIALEKTSLKLYPPKTLSIAMYGEGKTRGNISIIMKPMATNQACCNIMINEEKADFEYVYYYLKTQYESLRNLSSGVRNNLNANDIKNYEIRIPESLVEQSNISKILSVLDQKIALNNQINDELEAMAKTLYDYWFVQFDFPDENGKPYKSSGGKMVYNDQLKREIPEGWGVKRLGELSTYVTDKISSDVLNSKNYIGTDNMLSNMKGIEQASYLPNSTLVNSYIPNDILIANIRPYFKKIWISDRTGGCSSDVLCLRANDKEICNYLFYSLARDDFFNYNVAGSKGSKMPRGDKAHIQKYSVLFSEKHALKFSKLVSNFISQKHLIYKQNQELSQLRDWLLPMLMNGQVKVEEGD